MTPALDGQGRREKKWVVGVLFILVLGHFSISILIMTCAMFVLLQVSVCFIVDVFLFHHFKDKPF